eukprot:363171-Chlamydomonas_euryale.AAC.16
MAGVVKVYTDHDFAALELQLQLYQTEISDRNLGPRSWTETSVRARLASLSATAAGPLSGGCPVAPQAESEGLKASYYCASDDACCMPTSHANLQMWAVFNGFRWWLSWMPSPPPLLTLRQLPRRCRQLRCLLRSPSGNAPPLTSLMRSC